MSILLFCGDYFCSSLLICSRCSLHAVAQCGYDWKRGVRFRFGRWGRGWRRRLCHLSSHDAVDETSLDTAIRAQMVCWGRYWLSELRIIDDVKMLASEGYSYLSLYLFIYFYLFFIFIYYYFFNISCFVFSSVSIMLFCLFLSSVLTVRHKNHNGMTHEQLHTGINICRDCHDAVHKYALTEMERWWLWINLQLVSFSIFLYLSCLLLALPI
jgi:hypothetical protein